MSYHCRSLTVVLFLATFALGTVARADPPHKHALLIGISQYSKLHPNDQPQSLFADLNCEEDLTRIRAALVKTFKFKPGEITVLSTPEQATREGILAAFDKMIAETQPGDLVYIHYSGHGSQVPDPSKPDGLESTIVPSDYKDDQTNEITGVEIGRYLARLKEKKPVQIVLSFDSCHSGTISRGIPPAAEKRGRSYDEYVIWYKNKYHQYPPPHPVRVGLASGRGANSVLPELSGQGFVVLSACNNDQSAYEFTDNGKTLGRLSYVLSDVLGRATPDTTYQQVYDQVRARFLQNFADQLPQLDGDPNTTLMDGMAKELPPYILVSIGAPDHYSLDAGSLQGMTLGSEFAIYDKTATDFTPQHELAEARITTLDLTSADLELTKKFKPGLPLNAYSAAHAVETRHNYISPLLSLDAASVQTAIPAQAPAILNKLSDLKMVKTDLPPGTKADVKMARLARGGARGTAELGLYRNDSGTLLAPLDETAADLPTQVYTALQKQARYHYALGLGNDQSVLNPEYHVQLRLVPAEVKKDATGHFVFDRNKSIAETRSLQTGDYFTIEVQNTSPDKLFLTVLDLESNGDISQPWPSPRATTEANTIASTAPGTWQKLWVGSDHDKPSVYHATSADPQEVYKAIATDKYVSFKALRSRGATRGVNDQGPFGDLLGPAVDEGLRGTAGDPVDPGEWTAVTYGFQVQAADSHH